MRTRVNVPRSAAVLALCAAAAVATPSCRLAQRGSPATLEMRAVSTGTGLAVAARFAIPGDDLPKYLLETMPDSGIVPVRIAVRNEGTSPLLIHSANGMKLAPGFEGCSLVDDGRVRAPLPPRTVAERVLGKGAGRYRMRGATSFVAGSFIAPIEAFYIYSEIDVGRYYRPIFGKSFYPAFESGMMKPVRIEPGEERSGYLYFAMPGGAKPDSCELLVRACLPQETPRTLAGSGFVFSREERPSSDSTGCLLFKIGDVAGGGRGLYFARLDAAGTNADPAWRFVAPIGSKSAVVADVSNAGTFAACGVDFTGKSKVFLVRCGESPTLVAEKSLPRKIRRVFAADGAAFVVTTDAFCRAFNEASGTWTRGVKLGIDIDGTALLGDRLLAFSKSKGVLFFDASPDSPLVRLGEKPLRKAKREAIGLLDGALVLLTRGSGVRSDTLALFDTGAMGEIGRRSLPGKVVAASADGSNLIVQFEDGTAARIVRGSGAPFALAGAGFLPFEARTLRAVPGGLLAVGEDGAFAAGPIKSFNPGARGALELSVPVR
jgi:hypothetical protein